MKKLIPALVLMLLSSSVYAQAGDSATGCTAIDNSKRSVKDKPKGKTVDGDPAKSTIVKPR